MQAGAGQTGPQGESASGVPVTPVPLVVAVTGHRDLLESELPAFANACAPSCWTSAAAIPTCPSS